MKRLCIFVYGVLAYALSLATFLYTFCFLGNLFVPNSIDAPRTASTGGAFLIDIALLTLFGLQHSVMARPGFKRWWTRVVPEPAERSTYLVFSNAALLALCLLWQPLGGVLWQLHTGLGQAVLYAAYGLGWALLLFATFLINQFDLFGLRQVWLQLRGRPYRPVPFKTRSLYRYVRHPLYVGWLTIFWAAPTMTVTHLLFALGTSAYILIAIRLEERDLSAAHPEYEDYRRRVPMLLPRLARRAGRSAEAVLVQRP